MSLSSLIALTSICVAGCAVAAFTLLAMVHRRHLLRERNHYKEESGGYCRFVDPLSDDARCHLAAKEFGQGF